MIALLICSALASFEFMQCDGSVFGALYHDDFSSVLPESNAKFGRITVASGEVHSGEERLFLFEE